MIKNYIKIVAFFIIQIILITIDDNHKYIYLTAFLLSALVMMYQLNNQLKKEIKHYQRKKENEIHEVAGEKDFNYKILNSLIKTMNLPMIFVNKDGIIMFTNQRFRSAFDIKHLKGKYYKDIFNGQLLNIVDQSYIFERKFTAMVTINGGYYHVEAYPIFRDAAAFDGTIILFTDVSKVKEVERMQKQFLSDISHELKTPMSAIIGCVEILQKEGMQNKDTFDEFMGILLKESYRMKNILDDILELSRLEKTQASINPTIISLPALVKETVELFEPLAKEKHLSLVYQTKDVDDELYLDLMTIKTILNNLVSNAIKYSNQGVISIKCHNNLQNLTLIVQDEGIGINKEDIQFIFDRFYQVESSRSNQNGTGLGLSIVKKMVEINHGIIDVDSTPGIGTTFTVTLPLIDRA